MPAQAEGRENKGHSGLTRLKWRSTSDHDDGLDEKIAMDEEDQGLLGLPAPCGQSSSESGRVFKGRTSKPRRRQDSREHQLEGGLLDRENMARVARCWCFHTRMVLTGEGNEEAILRRRVKDVTLDEALLVRRPDLSGIYRVRTVMCEIMPEVYNRDRIQILRVLNVVKSKKKNITRRSCNYLTLEMTVFHLCNRRQ